MSWWDLTGSVWCLPQRRAVPAIVVMHMCFLSLLPHRFKTASEVDNFRKEIVDLVRAHRRLPRRWKMRRITSNLTKSTANSEDGVLHGPQIMWGTNADLIKHKKSWENNASHMFTYTSPWAYEGLASFALALSRRSLADLYVFNEGQHIAKVKTPTRRISACVLFPITFGVI